MCYVCDIVQKYNWVNRVEPTHCCSTCKKKSLYAHHTTAHGTC